MGLKNVFGRLTKNLKIKCEFCKKPVRKGEAHFEEVKLLEFVYPKKVGFCDEACASNYINYEKTVPRRVSLCSSCPTHPDAGPKINN